jgi:DNA repair exonuclease SbcCD ATPase subunit
MIKNNRGPKICNISDIHWRGIARHGEYRKTFEYLFQELREEVKPDLIINGGDVWHTKMAGITPESIKELAWMFEEFAKIAPCYTLLGNHDISVGNLTRESLVSSVHRLLKNPNLVLMEKSGLYEIDFCNTNLYAYSLLDKETWDDIKPDKNSNRINIALYHGPVAGCETDGNWRFGKEERSVDYFKDYDFTILGDIHKKQFLGYRPDKNKIEKPWIGFVGSTIQQNHGESIEKGYLTWDLRAKDDWDVTFKQIPNFAPFVSVDWKGSVEETIDEYKKIWHNKETSFVEGARFRIISKEFIPQIEAKNLTLELVKNGAAEVTFKTDVSSKMEFFDAGGIKILKKSLVKDPDTLISLYLDYVAENRDSYSLSEEQYLEATRLIHEYLQQLLRTPENSSAKNVVWSLKDYKFDNLYGYGENNELDFGKISGIIGILGPNRVGKSSVIAGILYVLFNMTDRGSIKNALIINRDKDYCTGAVRISVGGADYEIERRTERDKKDKEKSVTSVNLWKIKKDEVGAELKISINGITKDETDEIIKKMIGTGEDFLLTAFSSQGNLNRFIENKATKRKETLNRFLELDAFDKLYDFAKDDFAKLNGRNEGFDLDDWTSETERTKNEIAKIEATLEKLELKLGLLNTKRDDLNVWLRSHEQQGNLVELKNLDELRQNIFTAQREWEDAEVRLKDLKDKLKNEISELGLLEKALKKFDIDELTNNKLKMKELESTVGELRVSLEREKSELKSQERSVKKLTIIPCGDEYPKCPYIIDGHKAKETIEIQKELVGKLVSDYEGNYVILKKYFAEEIEKQLAEQTKTTMNIVIKKSAISELKSAIEQTVAKIDALKREIKEKTNKTESLQDSIDFVAGEEFQKKQGQLASIVIDLSALTAEKNDSLVLFGRRKETLQKLVKQEEDNRDLISKLKIIDSIQSAFSKNGIPAMVLKTQLPAINAEIANILGNLVDFSISLETDTTGNVMDIYLDDGKGKRLVELGSGMEKTICSLAIRVALGNLSSMPRPDIFVLDESFGFLDDENLQKGIKMLTMFREYFKSIFVITHSSVIKEAVDKIIEVKNNGIESSISL